MSHPRSLAALTRKALCLAIVMFCLGAWLAPAANAQLIGGVLDDVVGGGDGSSSSDGSGGGSTAPDDGGGSGGVIGGVIDKIDGKDGNPESSDDGGGGGGGNGGLIGGVIDVIDKTGGNTTDPVEEVTSGVGGNLGGVGQTIDDATNDTVKKVKKGLSGPSGKKTSDRPRSHTATSPALDTWDVLGESFMKANGAEQNRGAGTAQTSTTTVTPVASFDDSVVAQIGRIAAEAVEQAAFPLLLLMLVGGFLMVQNRIDRKDPKLALAPVDSEHDLLSFT